MYRFGRSIALLEAPRILQGWLGAKRPQRLSMAHRQALHEGRDRAWRTHGILLVQGVIPTRTTENVHFQLVQDNPRVYWPHNCEKTCANVGENQRTSHTIAVPLGNPLSNFVPSGENAKVHALASFGSSINRWRPVSISHSQILSLPASPT